MHHCDFAELTHKMGIDSSTREDSESSAGSTWKMMKFFLAFLFFFSIQTVFANDTATRKEVDRIGQSLTVGQLHLCILNSDGVKCYGSNKYGQTDVPVLSHPTQVTAGGWHTCALDDNGVKCWGHADDGKLKVPALKNPRFINAGTRYTCALDDDGIQCWGESSLGATRAPKLVGAKTISCGLDHACAVEANGNVRCWGSEGTVGAYQTHVPSGLRNVKQLAMGTYRSCSLGDGQPECWGEFRAAPPGIRTNYTTMPNLTNPRGLTAGDRHVCVIDDHGVACWGMTEYGEKEILKVPFAKLVSAGGRSSCVVDEDDALHCAGTITEHLPKISSEAVIGPSTIRMTLPRLEEALQKMSRLVTVKKSSFFKDLSKLVAEFPVDAKNPYQSSKSIGARYLIFELMGPVLETTYSEMIQEKVVPDYVGARKTIQARLGILNGEATATASDAFIVAAKMTRFSLNACREKIIDPKMQEELESLMLGIGRLEANHKLAGAKSNVGVDSFEDLKGLLKKHTALIDSLAKSEATLGFATLLKKVESLPKLKASFSPSFKIPAPEFRPPQVTAPSEQKTAYVCGVMCECRKVLPRKEEKEPFEILSIRRFDKQEALINAEDACLNYWENDARGSQSCWINRDWCTAHEPSPRDPKSGSEDPKPPRPTRWATKEDGQFKPMLFYSASQFYYRAEGATAVWYDKSNRLRWVKQVGKLEE